MFDIRHWTDKHRAAVILLVFAIALVPRLVGVGSFLTADEKNWMGRSLEYARAMSEGRIGDTMQSSHPGITTMAVTAFPVVLTSRTLGVPFTYDNLAVFAVTTQITMAIANALLVACIYGALRLLFRPGIALLAGLAIALNPFLIGHSKVVHTNAFLAGFLVLAALLFLYAVQSKSSRAMVISGIVSGLAIVSQVAGIFIVPFAALALLTHSGAWKKRASFFATWVLVTGISVAVFWPALFWQITSDDNPISFMQHTVRALSTPHNPSAEGGYELDLTHYPAALAARTTIPILSGAVMLLLSAFFLRGRKKIASIADSRTLLLIGAFVVFFVIMMTIGAKKADRYILPVFLMMDILGVVGIALLSSFLFRRRRLAVAALFILIPLVVHLVQIGPYTLAYYNPLFPPNLSQELGWGEGFDQIAAFLDDQPGHDLVASWYYEELRPFTRREVVHLSDHEREDVGWVVLYRNMFGRPLNHWTNTFIEIYYEKQEPTFEVVVNGLPYAWIYRK